MDVEQLVRWIARNSWRESTLLYGRDAQFVVSAMALCDQIVQLGGATKGQLAEWTNDEADKIDG